MVNQKYIQLTDVNVKFAANGAGSFKGYASVFGGIDSYKDTIERGAYTEVIKKIKDGEAQMPKMFVNHRSWMIPPGKWMNIEEDEKGLLMEGEFTPNNPEAEVVKAALQHGTVDGLSIGFELGKYEYVEEDGEKIRVIKSIKALPEVSIVTYPADESARVDLTSVKSTLDNIQTLRDFEEFLREVGGFSNTLAKATAAKAKGLFAQRESVALPSDLRNQILGNLFESQLLHGELK
jgi:HK97 family phage prohead protease